MVFVIFLVKINRKKHILSVQRWNMIDAVWEQVIMIANAQIN